MVKVIEIINHSLYFITLFFLKTMNNSDYMLQDPFELFVSLRQYGLTEI